MKSFMTKITTNLLITSIIFTSLVLSACTNTANRTNDEGIIIQWRGDRTGVFHETGLATSWTENGPELLWHFDGLGDGHSSPAVANGKIFVTGMIDDIGNIFAFDLDGNLLNQREYGPEWTRNFFGTRGTPTPSGNKVYFISGEGVIYCFDQNLNPIWSKNLSEVFNAPNIVWGITESPLIVGEKVIATPGGTEHNVVALNKNTGELVWSTPGMGNQSAYCSAFFVSDQEIPLIIQMTGQYILGIHADTGEMKWAFPYANQHQLHGNTPVYSNGMFLVTSGYEGIMLRLTNGGRAVEKVWTSDLLDNRMGGMVRVGDYIYGSGHVNPYWFCVNWYTGEVMWQEQGFARGITITNDGMLYLYTNDGDMVLARATPEKFDVVSQFSIILGTDQHFAHPIIYNGVLYVRRGDTLMAFDLRN
jgi:outer membrane protein assembly factor BamB